MTMPNFSYNDRAVVIAGSTEIPVQARLHKRFGKLGEEWYGEVTPLEPNGDFWAVEQSDTNILRTNKGEASFTPGHWVSDQELTGPMSIKGNGKAPF